MKKIRHSFFVVVFLCAVHALLCALYNYTYFSTEFHFQEKFQGILYWVMLMVSFLTGPFIYYVAGRLCKKKGSKKLILSSLLVMNIAVTILGIVSFFSEWCQPNNYNNAQSLVVSALHQPTFATLPAALLFALYNGSSRHSRLLQPRQNHSPIFRFHHPELRRTNRNA